jgi:hypothetical protein
LFVGSVIIIYAIILSQKGKKKMVEIIYLFEVEGDGDPFKASAVLQRGTLPPAVGSVNHVADGMPVLGVFIIAYLCKTNQK